jgi:hypothetical protein
MDSILNKVAFPVNISSMALAMHSNWLDRTLLQCCSRFTISIACCFFSHFCSFHSDSVTLI